MARLSTLVTAPTVKAIPDTTSRASGVEALLRELVAEVRGLRADLTRDRRPSSLPESITDLLSILAASVAEKAFSAREVIQHAVLVDGSLRAALDAAGLVSARKLGKFLKRIEGQTVAGLRLEQIGLDRDGVIWRVWRV